jgi:hypothetical protein
MKRISLLYGAAALGSLVAGMPAVADSGDVFNATVSYSWLRDNNIFRLSDGAAIGSSRSDTVHTLGVAATFDKTISRQRFRAEASLQDNRYDEHSNLNNQPYSGSLSWFWVLGNRLSGKLMQMNTRNIASFETYQQDLKDIYTTRASRASARYQVHPDWFVEGVVQDYEAKHSAFPTSTVDIRETQQILLHRRPNGDEFQLRAIQRDGSYPNHAAGVNYAFDEQQIDAVMTMVFTGASSVDASFGHLRRRNPYRPARDFSGQVWRLAWNWMPTGKLALTSALERRLGPKDDVLSTFALTDTLSLSGVWVVTDKVRAQAMASWWRSDFRGDPGLLPSVITDSLPRRRDDGRNFSLGLSYQILRGLEAALQFGWARRDSNYSGIPFSDRTIFASLRWTF